MKTHAASILLTIILAIAVPCVSAHIGETPEQVATRYGQPSGPAVHQSPWPPLAIIRYQKGALSIVVTYLDGKAAHINIVSVSFAERPDALKAMEDGCTWSSGMVHGGRTPYVGFTRSDGVLAKAQGNSLEIFTKDYQERLLKTQATSLNGL